MAKKWIINGVPAETIWRNKEVNGSYTVHFCKDDATLADIEGIDWAHLVVKRELGNDERFHCLPEGYGFKLNSVNYVGSMNQYIAEISVLKQYLGDVTGYQAQIEEMEEKAKEYQSQIEEQEERAKEYQAQIEEQETKISGLEEDCAAAKAAVEALENDVTGYRTLIEGKDSEISGLREDLDTAKATASALENDLERAYELLYGGEDA